MASLLTALRGLPARMIHPLRRRRVLTALRGRHPLSVLVVCHGNLCRSPFAAALLRAGLARDGGRVESAGFLRSDRPSPAEAIAAARRFGVDLSAHRSRLLTPEGVRAADLVVVMDPAQAREIRARFGRPERDVLVLGDVDPQPGEARTIRDPVNQPLAAFEESYARIARCVGELARVIGVGPDAR